MELDPSAEQVPASWDEGVPAETFPLPDDGAVRPPVVDLGEDTSVPIPDWQFEEPDVLSQLPENRISEEALVNAKVVVGPNAAVAELYEAYAKIKSDLTLHGISEDVEAIKTVLESDSDETRKRLTLEALQDPMSPQNVKKGMLDWYFTQRMPLFTALEEYHDSLLYGKEYQDERQRQLTANAADYALYAQDIREAEQAELNNAAARPDSSLGMAALDFIRMLAPGGVGYTAAEVSKELVGETSWLNRIAQQLFAGHTVESVRAHLETLEGEDRLNAIKKVNRVLEEVPLGGMHSMYMREDIVTGEYKTWQKWLDTVVGVLDVLGVGWTLKGFVGKAATKAIPKVFGPASKGTPVIPPASPIGIATTTDPDTAADMATVAIMGPPSPVLSEVEKAIGASKSEVIVDAVLPHVTSIEGSRVPDTIVGKLKANANELGRVLANTYDNSAYYITTADKTSTVRAFFEGTRQVLDDAAGAALHVNKSTIGEATYFGFKGVATYGQTAKRGYETPLETLEAAYKTSADPRDVVLFVKNMKTKRLEVYDGPGMAKLDDVANGRNVPVRKSMETAAALNKTVEGLQTDEVRALFSNAVEVTPAVAEARKEVLEAASKTLGKSLGDVKDTFKERWLRRVISGEAQLDKLAIKGVQDVKFNPEIGKFETRSGAYSDEFFFGIKYTHTFNPTDAATFGMDAVSRVRQWKYGGYLVDIVSGFNNQISSMFLHATNQANNIERKLLKDIISKHITPLSKEGKKRVFRALEDGSLEQKTFEHTKLVTKYGMNEKEIVGYYSFRQVSDAMYMLNNRRMKSKLLRGNMATVATKALDDEGNKIPDVFARGIKTREAADSTEQYVDLTTGSSQRLSKAELDDLYQRGGYVADLHSPKITKDNVLAKRIVVDPDKSTVRRLPDNPMPYIDGYYPRLYKEHYFVRHVPQFLMVNGSKITIEKSPETLFKMGKTVAAYGSKAEAEAAAKALEASGKGNFRAALGMEHDIDAVQEMSTLYSDTTRSMRKRNEHLAGAGDNLLATIEDPIEALETSLKAISQHTAKDDLVASMQKSWVESFGHLVDETLVGSKFPENVSQIARREGHGRAVALKQLIDTVNRPPTITDAIYRDFVFEIAHLFEQVPYFRSMAPTIRRESRSQVLNPLKIARKMSTQFYIALNPLRQILIQPGQLLQYTALEPGYMASGAMIRDMTAIVMAAASRGRDYEAAGLKAAAKVFSGDSKDFANVVDRFFETSGVPWAVDANQLIENSVKNMNKQTTLMTSPQRVANMPGAAWDKVVSVGKKGFEAGEFLNLAGSYLVAKRRWERANPGKLWQQRENANAIASDATKIAYAMTELGALDYQRGALGTIFQFMSVPHKALMSVTTNKYWSKGDKAKIALSNIALFGAYGVGANSLVESLLAQDPDLKDMDEDLVKLLKGGVMDWSINKFINEVFESESDLKSNIGFSEAASPFSGGPVPFATAAGNFFDGKWAEMVVGPAINLVGPEKGRFVQAAKFIQALVVKPEYETREKWLLGTEAVLGLASGVSNFTKARLWMDYRKGYDSKAQPTGIEHTPAEVFFKLFGYRPKSESAMWGITEAQNSDYTDVKKAFEDYIIIQRNIALRAKKDPNQAQIEAGRAANLLRQFTDDELMLLGKDAARMLRQPERDPDKNITTIIGRLFNVGNEPFSEFRNRIIASDLSAGQKDKALALIENLTTLRTLREAD